MAATSYQVIRDSLLQLYVDDPRPRLVGFTLQKGIIMSDWKETNRLRELQEEVAAEKGIRADTMRRLVEKVNEFNESHRAFGLPDGLLSILKDDLAEHVETGRN